jgi:hypothetical protein
MSAAEILDELPKLSPEEIELIYSRVAELHLRQLGLSEDDLAEIDEADRNFEKDGGVSFEEMEKKIKSWPTKLS